MPFPPDPNAPRPGIVRLTASDFTAARLDARPDDADIDAQWAAMEDEARRIYADWLRS